VQKQQGRYWGAIGSGVTCGWCLRWYEDGFVQLGQILIGIGMTGRPGEQCNMSISD